MPLRNTGKMCYTLDYNNYPIFQIMHPLPLKIVSLIIG